MVAKPDDALSVASSLSSECFPQVTPTKKQKPAAKMDSDAAEDVFRRLTAIENDVKATQGLVADLVQQV